MTLIESQHDAESKRLAGTGACLDAFFSASGFGLFLLDSELYFSRVNGALTSLLGYHEAALRKSRLIDIVCRDDRQKVEQMLASLMGRKTGGFEIQSSLQTGKDTYLWCLLAVQAVFDESGKPMGASGLISDLTRLRELETQLHYSQKLETLGRLSGGLAHEFNNTISVIQGNLELLRNRMDRLDPLKRYTEELAAAADHAGSITRRLVSYLNRRESDSKIFDMDHLLAGMEPVVQRLIGEDICLNIDRPYEPVMVAADRGRMEQVILNLAANARDAMPDGGSLTVALSSVEAGERLVPITGPSGSLALTSLTISDTGEGMDPSTKERACLPYFTTRENGSGLGLSTVREIVTQYGGETSIESDPEKGTTVRIVLPCNRSVQPKLSDAPAEDCTIMVVEDDDAIRELMVTLLSEEGYNTIQAGSVQEAMDKATAHGGSIEILVSDIVLPDRSGQDLADLLRSSRPEIKVLMTSGYPARMAVPDSTACFLQKPFRSDDLLQAVRSLLC